MKVTCRLYKYVKYQTDLGSNLQSSVAIIPKITNIAYLTTELIKYPTNLYPDLNHFKVNESISSLDLFEIQKKQVSNKFQSCIFICNNFRSVDLRKDSFLKFIKNRNSGENIIVDTVFRICNDIFEFIEILNQLNMQNLTLIAINENFEFHKNDNVSILSSLSSILKYFSVSNRNTKLKGRKRKEFPEGFKQLYEKWKNAPRSAKYTLKNVATDAQISLSMTQKLIKEYEEQINFEQEINGKNNSTVT